MTIHTIHSLGRVSGVARPNPTCDRRQERGRDILVDVAYDPVLEGDDPNESSPWQWIVFHLTGPVLALLCGYTGLCILFSFISLISFVVIKKKAWWVVVLLIMIQGNIAITYFYNSFSAKVGDGIVRSFKTSLPDVSLDSNRDGGLSVLQQSFLQEADITSRSLSVVVPCMNEGQYAVQTVQSIVDATAEHTLHEIIVVDDGSDPSMQEIFDEHLSEQYSAKVKILRNPEQVGLIGAKLKGGNAATGDVISFLDCHVKPRNGWEEELMEQTELNYKRIVVPVIGSLNPHTWQEIGTDGASKCYLTFDADFPWVETRSFSEVPSCPGVCLRCQNVGGWRPEVWILK